VLIVLVAAWTLAACSAGPTSLSVTLTDNASNVPLQGPLEVTVKGARLDRVLLERMDGPATAVQFEPTSAGSRLVTPLEPDAKYHLMATADPLSKTPLPWAEDSNRPLTLDRVFTTVRSPVLEDGSETVAFQRGKPVELKFSEPLVSADVDSRAVAAQTQVAREDPHILKLTLDNPRPGRDLDLRLTDVVSQNGVTTPEQWVTIHMPDAVELTSVSGVKGTSRVAIPTGLPVTLEWAEPVQSIRYRLGDETKTWSGAPTTRIELPIQLQEKQSQQLVIEDAMSPEGGWLATQPSFELVAAAPLRVARFWPAAGATKVTPQADPTFTFSEPIANHEAAEAAISFEPSVPGRFEWLAPDKVHFVPAADFPRETEITMQVKSGPEFLAATSGAFMTESLSSTFTTGKLKVIDVTLSTQRMVLLEDEQAVWTAPVATGVRGAETPPGTYQVQYKMAQARFRGVNPNGSRYDIPDVHWVMPFFGDYTIHGAYWRSVFGQPGSAGCISLTDANAKYVFDWAEVGTVVRVHA